MSAKRVVLDETTRLPSKGTVCTEDEDRCRHELVDSCDINKIVARFTESGEVPPQVDPGVYVDLTKLPRDLTEAFAQVERGKQVFAQLGVEVRNAFDNEPVRFLEAFESEDGRARLKQLGVLPPSEEELADRREAAIELRAEKRREARETAKRIEAAKLPPVPPTPAGSGQGPK